MKWINQLYTRSCGVPQESPFIFTWQVTTSMFLPESLQDTTHSFPFTVKNQVIYGVISVWTDRKALFWFHLCVNLLPVRQFKCTVPKKSSESTVTWILYKVRDLLILTILSPEFGSARCSQPPLLEVHYWWLCLTLCCCCLERDTEALRKLN